MDERSAARDKALRAFGKFLCVLILVAGSLPVALIMWFLPPFRLAQAHMPFWAAYLLALLVQTLISAPHIFGFECYLCKAVKAMLKLATNRRPK